MVTRTCSAVVVKGCVWHTPGGPGGPGGPGWPAGPVGPVRPISPLVPEGPSAPSNPFFPGLPTSPVINFISIVFFFIQWKGKIIPVRRSFTHFMTNQIIYWKK